MSRGVLAAGPVLSALPTQWKEATMPSSRRLLLACAIALPVGLLARTALSQDNIRPDPSLRLPRPDGAGLSPENRVFIDQAVGGATAMIETGRLAAQRAREDSVRRLGTEIAADQQALKDELARLARAKGYQPANRVPNELASLGQVGAAAGEAEFDRRYLTAQYQASRWLMAAYQNEMAATQDLELRTFTATQELTLRKHLETIQKAADLLGLRLEAPRNPPQY